MFKIILRVLGLLSKQKRLVSPLVFSNLVFAILILLEPIFFKEVIDILIIFSQDSDSQLLALINTLILWVCIGVFTIVIRIFVFDSGKIVEQ